MNSKSRDKKTNAEASKLRNHISMTEYEIARLSKTLRKRLATIQALEQAVQAHEHNLKHDNKNVVADQQEVMELNSDVQSLHGQIAILTNRQNDLKDEYLRLIGGCTFLTSYIHYATMCGHFFVLTSTRWPSWQFISAVFYTFP